MTTTTAETETKLMLADPAMLDRVGPALEALADRCRPGRTYLIHDTYLDTEDWWFLRAGLACRVRRQLPADGGPASAWLTCKQLARPADSAVSVRLEFDERLPSSPRAIRRLPGRSLGRRLRDWLAGREVRVLFEIRNRRTIYHVRHGKLAIEAAADVVEFHAGGKVAIEAEVELEARAGSPKQLAKFADALAARLLSADQAAPIRSKFESGLELAGLAAPRPTGLDELELSPNALAGDAGGQVIDALLGQMVWHDPGARLGLLAESLHQMRVTCRRLRAATRLFARPLGRPRAKTLADELRTLADALGRVRDLDVYLLNLPVLAEQVGGPARPLMARYQQWLLGRRQHARRELVNLLDGDAYRAMLGRLGRLVRTARPPGRKTIARFARRAIRKRYLRTLRFARSIWSQRTDEQLHRLRLRLKRLRYACEFVQSLFGRSMRRFCRRVIAVQGALGELQDSLVGARMLAEFLASLPARGSAAAEMRRDGEVLLAGLKRQGQRARRRFVKLWPTIARRGQRRRVKRMLA